MLNRLVNQKGGMAPLLYLAIFSASLGLPAFSQGVPVIDSSNLAQAISRVTEGVRDAANQQSKIGVRNDLQNIYEEQERAYEDFLANTTGVTNVGGFEGGGDGFASAAETYPAVEDHPDADRLFGENQQVEQMIIVVAKKYQSHAGVSAAGLTPLTWRILFQSLIKQESRFNNAAVSHVGARGFCQLMPGTASDLGVDPFDPWQNLDGGARYILTQLQKFKRVDFALAAYNAGPGNVQKYGGIPPFEETQNYVVRIRQFFNEYLSQISSIDQLGSITGGEGASAAFGNWADASVGYGHYMSGLVDQSMARISTIISGAEPATEKQSVDFNSYLKAEFGRLLALNIRLKAAQMKVSSADGMNRAAEKLEDSKYWRYK